MKLDQRYERIIEAHHLPVAQLPSHQKKGMENATEEKGILVMHSQDIIGLMQWVTNPEGRLTIQMPMYYDYFTDYQYDHGYMTPLHRHEYIELGYVVKGSICQVFSGVPYEFSEGSFWLSDCSCIHQDLMRHEELHTLFFTFQTQFFNQTFLKDISDSLAGDFFRTALTHQKRIKQYLMFSPPAQENEHAQQLVEQMVDECSSGDVGYKSIVMGLLARLLTVLFREYQVSYTSQDTSSAASILYLKILAFLMMHYSDVNLQVLADEFHYSPDFISRIIKQNSGLSYASFIQKIRVEKAAELLATTNLTIEDVMHQTGYQNRKFFGEVFSRYKEMTPAEYRHFASRQS